MAETYSTEFTALVQTKPVQKVNCYGVPLRYLPFTYEQVLAGSAADTIVLARLPACSTLLLTSSVMAYSGMTAGATVSLGWKAYTDNDGAIVAASAAGLASAIDFSNATGLYHGAMCVQATPDDFLPVVTAGVKVFNNRSHVDIYATVNDQAPGVNCDLRGYFVYVSMG